MLNCRWVLFKVSDLNTVSNEPLAKVFINPLGTLILGEL